MRCWAHLGMWSVGDERRMKKMVDSLGKKRGAMNHKEEWGRTLNNIVYGNEWGEKKM